MKLECGPEWDLRVIQFDANIEPSRCGILMSGGFDSYVLYNTIGKNNIGKIFNLKRSDRFDNRQHIEELIGRNDIIDIDEKPDWNAGNRIINLLEIVLDIYGTDIDALYFGINHIPHLYHFPEFAQTTPPHRPWRIDNSKILKTPFLHLYKYHIIDLANRLELDVSATQSCLNRLDSHCGECWQCDEREWGYQQLGYPGDPFQDIVRDR